MCASRPESGKPVGSDPELLGAGGGGIEAALCAVERRGRPDIGEE